MKILLEDVYKKTVSFLNRGRYEYIIIGGIAAGILGEPRVTGDVDVDIILKKSEIPGFFDKAKKAGLKFSVQECEKRIKATGTFQIKYGQFHIDFIIASIELEEEAIKRKRVIQLYNTKAFFPTPEDLILMKLVPGRPQDLLDAQRIMDRHRKNLDAKYLRGWARRLSDEAEDARIINELDKLLGQVNS